MRRKLLNEERLQTKDNPTHILSGRQIAYRIFEHFTLPPAEKESLDITHLVNLKLRNDNLNVFSAKWDEIVVQLRPPPPDGWLEALFKKAARDKHAIFADVGTLQERHIAGKSKALLSEIETNGGVSSSRRSDSYPQKEP